LREISLEHRDSRHGTWADFFNAVSPLRFGLAAAIVLLAGAGVGWAFEALDVDQAVVVAAAGGALAMSVIAWYLGKEGRRRDMFRLRRQMLAMERNRLAEALDELQARRAAEWGKDLLETLEGQIERVRQEQQEEEEGVAAELDFPEAFSEYVLDFGLDKGFTLWLTELPGAGKTTLAGILERELRERGIKLEILDGDVIRESLSKGLGFSREDRDTNIRRIAFVADLLSRNGLAVITTAISPYESTRNEARELIGRRFIEVYVKASIDVCAERDVKGLYRKAFAGEIKEFTGVSDPYEAPMNPEIELDTESEDPEESAGRVIAYLEEHRLIPIPSAEFVS
jgi:adenylylsulfate kinase